MVASTLPESTTGLPNVSRLPERQSGSVLIVALILIAITASLGVVVMRDNNIEQKLVANELFQSAVFRAAESAVDSVLTEDNIKAVINSASQSMSESHIDDGTTKADSTLEFVGSGLATGSSLAKFRSYNFSATGNATISSVDAASRIVQGSTRLAPSP